MKGGIAAFVAAVSTLDGAGDSGSISFIITGDEEGDADFGTVKMVEWLQVNDQVPDVCVVGEPTNPSRLGDVIKNGRRGSLSCQLRVDGVQGHVAYPHLADNPITRLIAMLAPVNGTALDGGNDYFDPSTANVTSIDTGNEAGNVIPASVSAKFNIRFNTEHNSDDLIGWLEEHFNRVGGEWTATWRASAQPFVTPVGSFTELMQAAIESVTGQKPVLSTSGGTSDARFITNICPVAEFGLVGQTMHQVDEHVDAADIDQLAKIYHEMLVRFFKGDS
jgi:succinyl-diaminopimelate desuccinylase